jgi:hypothetical protein
LAGDQPQQPYPIRWQITSCPILPGSADLLNILLFL